MSDFAGFLGAAYLAWRRVKELAVVAVSKG